MASFLVSPGVDFREVDLTTVIPAVPSTPGAFAGAFQWGPVLDNQLVSSENELVKYFGKPNNSVAEYFFSASNFLKYSNSLNVVRVIGDDSNASSIQAETFSGDSNETDFQLAWTPNSVSDIVVKIDDVIATVTLSDDIISFASAPISGTDNISVTPHITIKNEDSFEGLTSLNSSIFARYPGAIGNSLKVILVDSSSYGDLSASEQAIFSDTPETDEISFAVIDEDGLFTGTAGELLEIKEFLSKIEGDKFDDGSVSYYIDYINQASSYVYVTGMDDLVGGTISLSNGVSDDSVSTGELQLGYDIFSNSELIDVRYIVSGPADQPLADHIINIAANRRDCIAFISPLKTNVVNNPGDEAEDILAFRNTLTSSSYAVLSDNWKYQYDKYNDSFRWIPDNADVAGLTARTSKLADPWYSPAGLNRGQIQSVTKLAWNSTAAERDVLFPKGINSIVTRSGQGTFLYGDKTLLSRTSAFDAINVRMLFIILEKAISTAAQYTLFEFNDDTTRSGFRNQVNPYLRDVQGRRGIIEFKVVCDSSNNTSEVIDSNEFVADIYIKPNKVARFIRLNFVATRSGASFNEIIENNSI